MRHYKRSKLDSFSLRPKQSLRPQSNPRAALIAMEPARKQASGRDWGMVGKFTAAALAVVFVVQGLLYLSSARDASGQILGVATSAYNELKTAKDNLAQEQFAAAGQLFDAASKNINYAQNQLNQFSGLKLIVPQAQSTDHLLKGAGLLAESGKKLSEALELFKDLKVSHEGFDDAYITDRIAKNRELLGGSLNLSKQAAEEFAQVKKLPLDYQSTLETAQQQVAELNVILEKLIAMEDLYLGFFGKPQTYLLIFQNYDEARPTGGFIGTYGVLTMDQGKIKRLKIESIYEIDGQIHGSTAAPGPFQPEIEKWGMRDANWFADFPTSARKLLDFFEKGSSTADGVISATPALFEDLLVLTGPIEMPSYGVALDSRNFQEIVQHKTSIDYDRKLNEPKKLLDDFAPLLLDRLTNLEQEQWLQLLQILQDNLRERHILLYHKNPAVQKKIDEQGFSGRVLSTDFDYLMLVNSNLGGTKTDLEILQKAQLSTKVMSDGSLVNTLKIIRKNTGNEANKNYLRVLVPPGSQLIASEGFDEHKYHDSSAKGYAKDPDLEAWDQGSLNGDVYVRTESGKTEFAGWIRTPQGETRMLTLTYALPFKLRNGPESYSLLLQKQAGSPPIEFTGTVDLGNYSSDWVGDKVKPKGRQLNFSSFSNTDDFWAAVISR